ncbi:MAG: phospholipase, partial [Chloroflexi bacterium]|nr:phospholipase [Chloroflexota bacterium]
TTLLLFLLLSACTALPTTTVPAETASSNWYSIYFSEPNNPNAASFSGGPDAALANAIDQARASVDVAIHDLDLWSIRDALINAHRRGVIVRMVVESDYLANPEMEELLQAGIPIIEDNRSSLMHNKFVVIDQFEVWTGSMNFTLNGAYKNDNNLMRLRSTRLAEDFTAEFEEMFVDGEFGARSPSESPYQIFTIEGTQIEVYFSPEDDTVIRIIELIDSAQQSIHFMAFSFTSDPISDAIIAAHQRGVLVTGLFETSQASQQGGEFFRLADLDMDVALDGNPRNMHHKVIIIDAYIVITGSYNFSANAEERNDENTIILYNAEIAAIFIEEFQRVFALRR